MSERGIELLETAERQILELIDLLSARGEGALSLPCPGRENLGDGTVAALASHTADNYLRIGRFLEARGHARRSHADNAHDGRTNDGEYTAENVELHGLLQRLSAGRDALKVLADLTDDRLDTVPPTASFKFCDGQRTLEQVVVAGLLNHQAHQIDAVRAAIA
jgi:hypothetical protein